jgi:hypothetical protein
LTSDDNLLRPLAVADEEFQANFDRIAEMQHARIVANKALVDKAIKAQLIRNESVKDVGFREGQWVLVRAEARNKFEGRWYGPYRIDKKMPLGTYRLTDPQGNVVKTLINGQRLVTAHVTDENINRLWNSSKVQGALRKRDIKLMAPSPEVAALFEKENEDTMGYDELASIPKKEWKELLKRSGERSLQVREGGNLSLPDATHLKALEEGLTEGLGETTILKPMARTDHEARNEAQQTVMESQSTREIEETHNRQTKTLAEETPLLDQGKQDTSGLEHEELHPITPMDEDSSPVIVEDEVNEEEDRPDISVASQMDEDSSPVTVRDEMNEEEDRPDISATQEDSEAPPLASTASRMPSWKREVAASLAERQRVETPYRLRERPTKKQYPY